MTISSRILTAFTALLLFFTFDPAPAAAEDVTSQVFLYPSGIRWASVLEKLEVPGTPRIYVIRNPYFNASMTANGIVQVWTGLLLRL